MRPLVSLLLVIVAVSLAVAVGCGGGGGSNGSSTGTVSMSLTDAKPVLPDNVTNCFITIDEVLVHKPGAGWQSLPMVQTPYTIDLLQFTDGATTEFVPPVALESGKYTQVRLSVVTAKLRFLDPTTGITEDVTLTIPSGNLKTDKNFDFDVDENAAVDITVDFDLSQSIVVTGPAGGPSYILKPVLHIVRTDQAATIEGTVANGSFVDDFVVITVVALSNGEEYTKVQIDKDTTPGATETAYSIFWLVPNQDYRVEIDYDPVTQDPPASDASKDVSATDLGPGEIAVVNFP